MKHRSKAILRRQRKKGIISQLRGKKTLERKRFADRLKMARMHRAKVEAGTTIHYANMGSMDARSYFEDIHKKFPEFFERLLSQRKHVRMLDIGPGTAEYVRNISFQFNNWGHLEMHTLSPELIGKSPSPDDPNKEFYVKINHTVGAIETVNPAKLGRFDLIVSKTGGTSYTPYHLTTIIKTARMLNPGGIAWLGVNFILRAIKTGKLKAETVQKNLGKNFRVKLIPRNETGIMEEDYFVIERIH